ncbi:MAG: methyltransferase domain-containing protein [Planctomycetaceae bacterium]|nr:methyltransferase domain-containing protein [Planctomycetaceae bacterium]
MPPSPQTVSHFFDSLTADYTAAIERCFPRYREMFWAIFEYLPERRFERILELGSGTGNLSVVIHEQFPDAHLTCVDCSGESLDVCRERLGKGNIEIQLADFRELEFPAETFDLITSSIAIHHLTSDEKQVLLQHCWSWLRPGGILTFADQFRGETDDLYTRHIENWKAISLAAGATEQEFAMWMEHQREHDHHDPLRDHFAWLSDAGFESIDCVWRYLLWGVVQARKPVS